MGAQLRYGTAGATGGGWSSQPGSLQATYEVRCEHQRWAYQRRGPRTWRDKPGWFSAWSFGCKIGNGVSGSDGAAPLGGDMTQADLYEPYTCDGEGCQTKRFIKGTVVDASDVAVSGAIVQGFVTSTDAYVGEVQSREDGSYDLGTETLAGVAHYLVAYKPGSPDTAGTTVNTLTSTNVDGT